MSQRRALDLNVSAAFERLRDRVLRVAAIHRRGLLLQGAGKLFWQLGSPLLVIILLQMAVNLPFYLRLPVLPALGIALLWLCWRLIVAPLIARYSVTQAALLVEAGRPQLSSRLVSALECYGDLHAAVPRFSGPMVEALVLVTDATTTSEDFAQAIDHDRTVRHLLAGVAVLFLWAVTGFLAPHRMADAFRSMGSAWGELQSAIDHARGARIDVDPLQPAYLRGETIVAVAHPRGFGFEPTSITVFYRPVSDQKGGTNEPRDWKSRTLNVTSGSVRFEEPAQESLEIYFSSGTTKSTPITALVTDKPDVVNIKVEYDLPDYCRQAPIIRPKINGDLDSVYGTTVILTIRANKPLAGAELTLGINQQLPFGHTFQRFHPIEVERPIISGEYARVVIRLNDRRWLDPAQPLKEGSYSIALTDKYGFHNDPSTQQHNVVVKKDQAPEVAFIGLPQHNPADEPHVQEPAMKSLLAVVSASDDFGVTRVTLHYRVEDLITGAVKRATRGDGQDAVDEPPQQLFQLPRRAIPQLVLARLGDLHVVKGERLVFWAEAEDAYDLEPEKGPHRTVTPQYRIAVIPHEEVFNEVIYKDDWSAQWYDALKVATLNRREIPPRQSPDRESASVVAKKLQEAPQTGDSVQGADRQLVQDYFDSLNAIKK